MRDTRCCDLQVMDIRAGLGSGFQEMCVERSITSGHFLVEIQYGYFGDNPFHEGGALNSNGGRIGKVNARQQLRDRDRCDVGIAVIRKGIETIQVQPTVFRIDEDIGVDHESHGFSGRLA